LVAAGTHGARRPGVGEEFWQFRPALPGEPIARIDWRQSARTTHAWVREVEAESAQTVCLWCDLSPSMLWRSDTALDWKCDRALLLTLALADVLLRGGERVRLIGLPGAPLFSGRCAMDRLGAAVARQIDRALTTPEITWPEPALVGRYARTVLIGDFLWETERLGRTTRALATRPSRLHLVRISDPAERSLPYTGRVRFTGLEGETPVVLPSVETLHEHYAALSAAHGVEIRDTAHAAGADVLSHTTDQSPAEALLALHARLGSGHRA
ncbi:DUF58 domain-containing protein, partial [Ameyamaea chiangmaiensis]